MQIKKKYILKDKDGIELAEIEATVSDFPWFVGRLTPKSDFDKYRPIFEKAEEYIKVRKNTMTKVMMESLSILRIKSLRYTISRKS